MYIYIYICVCVYVYVRMCVYICIYIYIYTPVNKENVERSADTSTKYARADGLSGCIVYYELL